MRKPCSNVCKLHPCLATELTNSARMRTIVTAAMQRQYTQTELTFWISLVLTDHLDNIARDNCERLTQTDEASLPFPR
jgi:hypothetical protein